MIELDQKGSKFCSYQASIFENSLIKFKCSSKIFMRRFFYSNFAVRLDFHSFYIFSLDQEECFKSILEDYGDSTYGKEKLNADVLYYVGYISRYICYTRNVTSRFFYHTFGVEALIKNYEVFHTQSEEYVISELLRINKLDDDIFDEEKRFKNILLRQLRSNPAVKGLLIEK